MNSLQTTQSQTIAVAPSDVSMAALESALAGDLKRLTTEDRLKYVSRVCELVGLNPLTKPFDFIELNGKLVLYPNKSCAEQLRKINGVSVDIVERKVEFGVLCVRAKATDRDGRHDESLAAVPFNEKNPELASNAMMKAETKAKRRVTLSICGLGFASDYDGEPQCEAHVVTSEISSTSLAAKLNASLTEGEKAQSITVESAPEPVAKTVPVTTAPATIEAEIVKPSAPVTAAPTVNPNALPEELVTQIETILVSQGGETQSAAMKYLIAKNKIKPFENLDTLKRDAADFIVKNPERFFKMVADWKAPLAVSDAANPRITS